MYKFIKTEIVDHQFILTLSRSEKRNAFTPTMVNEIEHAFVQANSDDNIKIVIIKAEGSVFCAGMDLKTFEDPSLDEINPNINTANISLGEVFDKLEKPSIALVEGPVIAGGFMIILGCTYVFCKENIQFKLPELDLGIFPFQVMASLLKVMPEKKVLQLCLNTDYFSAQKAKELGIVDEFLEEIDLVNFIQKFANKSSKAMSTGIKSLRELPNVAYEDRFKFLKDTLDNLKKKS